MPERPSLAIRNPRTGTSDYTIAPLSGDDIAALAVRLRASQRTWAARSLDDRIAVLQAFATALAERAPALTAALEADTGRRAISALEVRGVQGMVAKWAAAAPPLVARVLGERRASVVPGISSGTSLRPYALVGAISPWNFPLTLALIDAIPALVAGCAVIVKPSEVTPRFVAPLMDAVAAVPDLAGVFAVVEGDGATGAALVEAVDMLVFTGSVATGRKVGEAAARRFIPTSLELGGKDPMLVLASAEPIAAAHLALRASIVATGQACQSIERVYVAREIYEPFLAELIASASAVTLNWPDIGRGDIGPFIHAPQAALVQAQIDDALAQGAVLHAGGHVEALGGGLYLRPTVLTGVRAGMAVIDDETFGPVIPATPFDTVDEAVALANTGQFGLSAAVVAGTVEEAESVAARLDAGAVSINDGALTNMVGDVEKASFGLSGLGASRMGDAGLLRFYRRQALIRQEGLPLPLAAYSEAG